MRAVSQETEYKGDSLVLLPKDFMNSVEAAVEIHAEQISAVASNLHVRDINLGPRRKFFRRSLLATALWLLPTIWMICN